MSEYIEREKFKAEVRRLSTHYLNEWDTLGVLAAVDRIPAADVRPVVRGKWVDEKGNPVPFHRNCPASGAYGVNCSVCGEWLSASDEYSVVGNFCPNCGADMREES